MNEGFPDALKCLQLQDGVDGVRKLRPADAISKILPNLLAEYLYIVVKRPSIGECLSLCAYRGSDRSLNWTFHCVSSHDD
jgi:hypothetical protein